MFNGKDDFKFQIRFEDTFTLERLLFESKIEFHNELEYQTNSRPNKYYIKNSDRIKFDKLCKENKLEVFLDSLPIIETRFSNNSSNILYLILSLFILSIIILIIVLINS